MKQVQKGFTLIELMIVVAIIGILAAVAIPAYSNYTKKAKFTEVVQATQAMKTGVDACYSDTSDLTQCANGSNGVPAAIPGDVTSGGTAKVTTAGTSAAQNYGKYVDYVVVSPTSTSQIYITAAAANKEGLLGDTYILSGTVGANGNIDWSTDSASSCLTHQICK